MAARSVPRRYAAAFFILCSVYGKRAGGAMLMLKIPEKISTNSVEIPKLAKGFDEDRIIRVAVEGLKVLIENDRAARHTTGSWVRLVQSWRLNQSEDAALQDIGGKASTQGGGFPALWGLTTGAVLGARDFYGIMAIHYMFILRNPFSQDKQAKYSSIIQSIHIAFENLDWCILEE